MYLKINFYVFVLYKIALFLNNLVHVSKSVLSFCLLQSKQSRRMEW